MFQVIDDGFEPFTVWAKLVKIIFITYSLGIL